MKIRTNVAVVPINYSFKNVVAFKTTTIVVHKRHYRPRLWSRLLIYTSCIPAQVLWRSIVFFLERHVLEADAREREFVRSRIMLQDDHTSLWQKGSSLKHLSWGTTWESGVSVFIAVVRHLQCVTNVVNLFPDCSLLTYLLCNLTQIRLKKGNA